MPRESQSHLPRSLHWRLFETGMQAISARTWVLHQSKYQKRTSPRHGRCFLIKSLSPSLPLSLSLANLNHSHTRSKRTDQEQKRGNRVYQANAKDGELVLVFRIRGAGTVCQLKTKYFKSAAISVYAEIRRRFTRLMLDCYCRLFTSIARSRPGIWMLISSWYSSSSTLTSLSVSSSLTVTLTCSHEQDQYARTSGVSS